MSKPRHKVPRQWSDMTEDQRHAWASIEREQRITDYKGIHTQTKLVEMQKRADDRAARVGVDKRTADDYVIHAGRALKARAR